LYDKFKKLRNVINHIRKLPYVLNKKSKIKIHNAKFTTQKLSFSLIISVVCSRFPRVDKDLDGEANKIDPNGIDAILGADRATPAGGDGGGVAGGTT
jgi:hypothetical protein